MVPGIHIPKLSLRKTSSPAGETSANLQPVFSDEGESVSSAGGRKQVVDGDNAVGEAGILGKSSKGAETSGELRGRLRKLEGATLGHAHKFIVGRWKNLQEVRRMAGAWLIVIAALVTAVTWQGAQFSALYSVDVPTEGTVYTEGVIGAVDNLNPIFASTPAEKSVSRLVFSALYQEDERGTPQPELAASSTVDGNGKVYTIALRRDARWQDGVPITAKDVSYTFSAIKDADARSQLYNSWRNITVEQVDDYTVRFTLPATYPPFLNALTVGILPEHILGKVRAVGLRSHSFSRSPTVGSGPFVFRDVRSIGSKEPKSVIRLDANDNYFLGAPKPSRFQIHTYNKHEDLVKAFQNQEIAAIADETNTQMEALSGQKNVVRTDSPLYNAVYAFMQMGSPILGDVKVRNALELATDQGAVIKQMSNRVQPVAGPLLSGQLGYAADLHQSGTNLGEASRLLDEAGWKLGSDGKRVKNGQQLKLRLVTLSSGDFPAVAQTLMSQWSKIGVSFDSQLVKPEDIQQNVIIPRAFDVLLYELAIGKDPDVYAYWHSSQANDRGFNISGYKSTQADDALEGARSRADEALRVAKYRTFIQRWLADVPAIGLYRPNLTYIETKGVTSFKPRNLSDPVERYDNVRSWSSSKVPLRPTL
jgi:peptide/nickel transport system substrate-binding protein